MVYIKIPVQKDYDPKDFFERMESVDIPHDVLHSEEKKDMTRYIYVIDGLALDFIYRRQPSPSIEINIINIYGTSGNRAKLRNTIEDLLPD